MPTVLNIKNINNYITDHGMQYIDNLKHMNHFDYKPVLIHRILNRDEVKYRIKIQTLDFYDELSYKLSSTNFFVINYNYDIPTDCLFVLLNYSHIIISQDINLVKFGIYLNKKIISFGCNKLRKYSDRIIYLEKYTVSNILKIISDVV
jgi:hypothetical protein